MSRITQNTVCHTSNSNFSVKIALNEYNNIILSIYDHFPFIIINLILKRSRRIPVSMISIFFFSFKTLNKVKVCLKSLILLLNELKNRKN